MNAMIDMSAPDDRAPEPPADWVDQLLLRDAAAHEAQYLPDDGFTARVMQKLPAIGALPAWRKPAVIALWAIAGILLAIALPGVALDVTRSAYKLFAARPFALSTVAFMVVAIGAATWTAAAVALRRD
jgi:hypothetical protein